MKSFATVPRTSGANPQVVSIPDTSPGSKDGTPLHQYIADDWFGFFQSLMNGAGATPDGNAEAAGGVVGNIEGSQLTQAIQAMFSPAGEVKMYPHDSIPTGARLLKLNGQVITRTDYPVLVSNVERTFASGMSGYFRCNAGGSSDPVGDYMKLPDYNGLFPRGRDVAASVDPDGASRLFGDLQYDSIQRHNHVVEDRDTPIYLTDLSVTSGGVPAAVATPTKASARYEASGVECGDLMDPGFTGITPMGRVNVRETRAINFVVQWCITY